MMMSFMILTQENNCIVIDGGRKEDMPLLKKYIADRPISAWILTHPHEDHIGGFISEIRENNGKIFNIDKIYYNFPPLEILENQNDNDEISQATEVLNELSKHITIHKR